jgi:hypothetical protein
VLDRALRQVAKKCGELCRDVDYDIFCEYYLCESERRVTWQELATKYELATWKHAARRADYVKVQLGAAIRNEIRQYANNDDEVDDELRSMIG